MRSSFCLPTYFSSLISVWSFLLSSLISSWVLTVYFSSLNIYLHVEERLDNRLIWLGLQSYHLCSLSMVGFCIAFPSWTLQSGGVFIMCCVVAAWQKKCRICRVRRSLAGVAKILPFSWCFSFPWSILAWVQKCRFWVKKRIWLLLCLPQIFGNVWLGRTQSGWQEDPAPCPSVSFSLGAHWTECENSTFDSQLWTPLQVSVCFSFLT